MTTDTLTHLRADTIDEVLRSLDRVVEWSKTNDSRLGYFAALYRKVTRAVKQAIADGVFIDGPRMERLDVIFANRYLIALELYLHDRERTPRAWRLAFDTAERWWPIVLQHLLLGMNAHINMDLAIAAVETAPDAPLADLKADFFAINRILAGLVEETRLELAEVWPLMRLIDKLAKSSGQGLSDLGMWLSRGHAWLLAEELALLGPEDRARRIALLDRNVAGLGAVLLPPGGWINLLLGLIRLGELRYVRTIIEILE